MKTKLRNIFILTFSVFFFMLSSGVIIHIHQCCTQHHHAKNEHVHCHDTKVLVKIKGEFIKSEKTHFSMPVMETTSLLTILIKPVFEIVTPHYQYTIPPLLKLVGVNFVNFTSQRIFYS